MAKKRGLTKKIILCGYQAGWKTSTADIMKRHALSLDIPEDAIILDYGWNTHGTWDNAINSLRIVKGNNFLDAGLPESFHVLIKELQGLCLDMELLGE